VSPQRPSIKLMSVLLRSSHRWSSAHSTPGQSLVEFALLLPLLLVILLGVADFGRIFHAGIVMESASRAAAEAGAIEYLREVADKDATYVLPQASYDRVRAVAVAIACREAQLPNADPDTLNCPGGPAVSVCVHDAAAGDANCGDGGAAPVPPECTAILAGMDPSSGLVVEPTDANEFPRGAYVEVRTCYRFSTLFELNITLPMNTGLGLGDVFLQKEAVFTVADY
jgi:TadE-like protein